MSDEIIYYLRKRYHQGKSRVAYFVDLILSRLILFVALFLLFWYLTFRSAVALIISAMVTAIFSIVSHTFSVHKFEVFAKEEYAQMRNKYILEQILILNNQDLNAYMLRLFQLYTKSGGLSRLYGGYWDQQQRLFCYLLDNHPTNPVSAQQMLSLFRIIKRAPAKKYLLLTASHFSDEARVFLAKLPIEYECLEQPDLIRLSASFELIPDERQINDAIEAELHEEAVSFSQLKQTVFAQGKAKAYVLCALVLALWPLLIGFHPLYPILSCACVILAFFSTRRSKNRKRIRH